MYDRAFCIKSSISSAEPGDEGADEPNALPKVPTNTGTASASKPKCSTAPRPVGADDAEAVGVVDDQPCVVDLLRERAVERANVTVHAEHAVGGNHGNVVSRVPPSRFGSSSICVREAFEARARQQAAIDQGRVAQPSNSTVSPRPGQRRHHGEVRHVARGEQQRALAPGEGGEFFFQPGVLSPVPGHQMRSTAA